MPRFSYICNDCGNEFDLLKARKILGLGDTASLSTIKKAYHEKIKEAHPDLNRNDFESNQKTIELKEAYNLIIDYCQSYKFSFAEDH